MFPKEIEIIAFTLKTSNQHACYYLLPSTGSEC